MSNIDGDAQEFDDLKMPTDEFDSVPADGMPDPTAQSPLADNTEDVAAEDEGIVADSKKAKKAKKDKTDKSSGPKSAELLSKIAQASPYTVMLAISVLAIGIALLCLILEWSSYGFNRKPPKNLTMSRSIEAVPPHVATDARCDCAARAPAGFDRYRRFDPWRCV